MRSVSAAIALAVAAASGAPAAATSPSHQASPIVKEADGTIVIAHDIHAEPMPLREATNGLLDEGEPRPMRDAMTKRSSGRDAMVEHGIEDNLREAFEEALDIARFER